MGGAIAKLTQPVRELVGHVLQKSCFKKRKACVAPDECGESGRMSAMQPVPGVPTSGRTDVILHPKEAFLRPPERRRTRSRLELLPPELIRRVALMLEKPRDIASLAQVCPGCAPASHTALRPRSMHSIR